MRCHYAQCLEIQLLDDFRANVLVAQRRAGHALVPHAVERKSRQLAHLRRFSTAIELDHTDLHLELDVAVRAEQTERLGGAVRDRVGQQHALDLVENDLRLLGACRLHAEREAQHPRLGRQLR